MSAYATEPLSANQRAFIADHPGQCAWLWADAVLHDRSAVLPNGQPIDVHELGAAVRDELTQSPAIETQALFGVNSGALTIERPGAVERFDALASKATILTQAFLYGAGELDPDLLQRAADPDLNLQLLQSPPEHLHELFVVLAAAEVAVSEVRRQLHDITNSEPSLKVGVPAQWWQIHRGENSARRMLKLLDETDSLSSNQSLDAPVTIAERESYLVGLRERLVSDRTQSFQAGTSRDAEVLDLIFLERELARPQEFADRDPEPAAENKSRYAGLRDSLRVLGMAAATTIGGFVAFRSGAVVDSTFGDLLLVGGAVMGLGGGAVVAGEGGALVAQLVARPLKDVTSLLHDRQPKLEIAAEKSQAELAVGAEPIIDTHDTMHELRDQVAEVIGRQCFADDVALDQSPHLLDRSSAMRAQARRLMVGEAVKPETPGLWPAYRSAVTFIERDRVNGQPLDLESLPNDTQQALLRLTVVRHAASQAEKRLDQVRTRPDSSISERKGGITFG